MLDSVAHARRGVVLHVAHEGGYSLQTMPLDGSLDFGNATRVGGELCLQVRQVLIRITCRVARRQQSAAQLPFAQLAGLDERKAFKQNTFLLDLTAERRHGS